MLFHLAIIANYSMIQPYNVNIYAMTPFNLHICFTAHVFLWIFVKSFYGPKKIFLTCQQNINIRLID